MRKVVDFDLFEDADKGALRSRLAGIEKAVDAHTTKADGDILEHTPERKRAAYKEAFDLIYDCSVNQVAAKSLIDRMLDCLSRS